MYLFSPFSISVCFPPHCYCPEITLPNKTIICISVSGWRRLEKEMAAHSGILAWRILWTRRRAATVHGGHRESDMTERLDSTRAVA